MGLPLGAKLALAVFVVAASMLVFLLTYLGPQTTRAFLSRSAQLIGKSHDAMRRMAHENTSSSSDILVDLIHHTAESRSRTLCDLPLSLHGGNVERIREAIRDQDATRTLRLQGNVAVLASEMERRAMARIDDHVAAVSREQVALSRKFAADLRRSYLILVGSVLSALILLLGVGLYRLVVRPLRLLRAATHSVTRGDLDVVVRGHRSDEVGALSADFGEMVRQLAESRKEIRSKNHELERWNEKLEAEVDRKTKQLIHAAKMASIGTLAGGVAHEFNNLMGGIRGCVKETLASETDAGRREPLEVVLRATDRATDITDQLLKFARQRVGEMEHISVSQLLDEALKLVKPQARRLGVSLRSRFGKDVEIEADPSALHQVFLNLLANALQAMPHGGELHTEVDANGESVTIRVSDTGVGIPPEALDHVFDPFYTTKGEEADVFHRGTGLGLSVSYSIVEAHGGTMTVDSTPGQGSTFSLTIPVQPEPSNVPR
jgi:signal transduction histidine kinase